jgi:hypothetical protein
MNKILWATGFNNTYYTQVFQKVKHSWNLLPGDVHFYTDESIADLTHDVRAMSSGIDLSKCPTNLSRKESKFWKKSLCIATAVRASLGKYDYCIWLDADVTVTKTPDILSVLPTGDELLSVNNKIVTSVDSTQHNAIDIGLDTGFLAINLHHPNLVEWLEQYENIWNTTEMNSMLRKYDTYTLELILKKNNYNYKNLWHGVHTSGKHYCGFEDSDLAHYFFHHWGKKRKRILEGSVI